MRSYGSRGFRNVSQNENSDKLEAVLHHIGIVVSDISKWSKLFEAFGLKKGTMPEPDPIQKVKASFIWIGKDVFLELIEPTHATSPVNRFLEKRGDGLHHLCFRVSNLDSFSSHLILNGLKMIKPPVECVGFNRCFNYREEKMAKIAFFMAGERVLLEILEIP